MLDVSIMFNNFAVGFKIVCKYILFKKGSGSKRAVKLFSNLLVSGKLYLKLRRTTEKQEVSTLNTE